MNKRKSLFKLGLLALGLSSPLLKAQNTPLIIYDGARSTGQSAGVRVDQNLQAGEIPGNLRNRVSSFFLRRGYGVTFSADRNNWDTSKVYIAANRNYSGNLPPELNNRIEFIRVFRINPDTTKKGYNGGTEDFHTREMDLVDATWYYNWRWADRSQVYNTPEGTIEFALQYGGIPNADRGQTPMVFFNLWGEGRASHCIGFNEPERELNWRDCVDHYPNMLRAGLPSSSPAYREDAPNREAFPFYRAATARDHLVSFMTCHWYDRNNDQNPQESWRIVQRMQNQMQRNQDLAREGIEEARGTRLGGGFMMPMWIKEYNTGRLRDNDMGQTEEFITEVGPWLTETSWIHRHAYYHWTIENPDPDPRAKPLSSFTRGDATRLTRPGRAYRDMADGPIRYPHGPQVDNLGY